MYFTDYQQFSDFGTLKNDNSIGLKSC